MALTDTQRLPVEERSHVAPVRRAAESLAAKLGLDEQLRGEAAIVATEMAANLVRHTGGGEVVLRPSPVYHDVMDVITWDRGPGIADVRDALRDGVSTVGGAGNGLGAMGRLSATFDLQSTPGRGTAAVARLGPATTPRIDGLALAMKGEEASGDAWSVVHDGAWATILLVDGLGHGVEAARAAAAAVRELRPGVPPEALLERMHDALRPTRGAAAAIARLNRATGTLRFAGIGNIAARIVDSATTRALVSMNGTLGHSVRRFQGFDYQLASDALLVMHSDGCSGGWDLALHPGLVRRDPLVIASVLVRDFERGRDDVSVIVAKGYGAPE
jgi:anti-sigma regulatory factor (Ser/Thr protein kinase)